VDEDRAPRGVDPDAEVVQDDVEHALAELLRGVVIGQRLVVGENQEDVDAHVL